jgi:hypothetical protein
MELAALMSVEKPANNRARVRDCPEDRQPILAVGCSGITLP